MKLVHSILTLICIITTANSSVIRDFGLKAFAPEFTLLTTVYELLQKHATEQLPHMDIQPEEDMTTVSK